MDEREDGSVPEFIVSLSDHDLRAELIKNKVAAVPVTSTTRKFLESRLAKKLGFLSAFRAGPNKTESKEEKRDKSPESHSQGSSVVKAFQFLKSGGKSPKKEPEHDKEHGENQVFYGVFISKTGTEARDSEPLVFERKSSALSAIKGQKNARFKIFESFENAKEFSLNGAEESSKTAVSSLAESEEIGHKFPTLNQVDLNQLMRYISNGDLEQMKTLIWLNPKYLISYADGPVVLKPSTRYNALHIAAKANQSDICREILSAIENVEFQALMFPNMSDKHINNQRAEHLLDAYLNTPEKFLYETPLHFACKMGFKNVVTELISYTQCSTTALNKSGKTPSEIICSRASSDMKINQAEIHRLLGDQYYVPLLRYHDNSEHAIVGTPITSKQHPDEFVLSSPSSRLSNPSAINDSPLRPSLAVSALAGPMLKEQAVHFQKNWMTPSKCKSLGRFTRFLRRADSEKGDEQIGRQLAETEHVGWVEYWDFLSGFANFATEEGLQKLEAYLSEKLPILPQEQPKASSSQDILQLADMLEGFHLDQSSESLSRGRLHTEDTYGAKETPIQTDSDNSKTSGSYSNYNTTPEHHLSSQDTDKKDPIRDKKDLLQAPKSHLKETNHENCPNGSGEFSEIQDSNFVKNLFAESSVENTMDDISNFFSVDSTNEDKNQLSSKDFDTYRSPVKSNSDGISSISDSYMSVESYQTECPQKLHLNIFLAGSAPSKLDRDVLIAIGDADIDAAKFPTIILWKRAILSFSVDDRQKWATPRKERSFTFNPDCNSTRHGSPFSPAPSSGSVKTLLTPNRDMRRFLFKPFTPPSAR